MLERILKWDREAFIYLNGLGIEEYDAFWAVITTISTWIPLFLLFSILLVIKHRKKEGLFMVLTLILLGVFVLLATEVTKEYVTRLRPNNNSEINTVIRIIKSPGNYSFFSGHAATSFSITTLVVLFLRKKLKWVWVFYLWPILFTFSRIYVGVHYPLDIIAGAIVGVLSAFLFYNLYRKLIAPYTASTHP